MHLKELFRDLKKIVRLNSFGTQNKSVLSHKRETWIMKPRQFRNKILDPECEHAIIYLIDFLQRNKYDIDNGTNIKDILSNLNKFNYPKRKLLKRYVDILLQQKCRTHLDTMIPGLSSIVNRYTANYDPDMSDESYLLRMFYNEIFVKMDQYSPYYVPVNQMITSIPAPLIVQRAEQPRELVIQEEEDYVPIWVSKRKRTPP